MLGGRGIPGEAAQQIRTVNIRKGSHGDEPLHPAGAPVPPQAEHTLAQAHGKHTDSHRRPSAYPMLTCTPPSSHVLAHASASRPPSLRLSITLSLPPQPAWKKKKATTCK